MTNKKHWLRLQKLEALDDKRLQAQQQIELYQARITRAFNNKVKERTFKKGDLVLAVRRPMVMTHKTKEKFQPKWEGPFVVESVYSNRAYRLITPDGDMLMMPINGRFLKKYYPWQDSSHDQVNITPLTKTFRSKMFERAPKKKLLSSLMNHITVDHCRADRTRVTLWCMM